jgi:uncharacterized protein YegP (UPF0339 family)
MVRFHPYKAKDGKWHFTILAGNRDIVAESEAFGSKDECESAVDRLNIEAEGIKKEIIQRLGRDPQFGESLATVKHEVKKFESEQELLEELMKEIKDRARSGSLLPENAYYEVRFVLIDRFLGNAQTSWPVDRTRIESIVMQQLPTVFPAIFETLSPTEKERMKSFFAKTTEELTAELVSYFEDKRNWAALFDRSPQGRRNSVIERFWQEKYPEVIPFALGSRGRIVIELKGSSRLREIESRIYNLVLKDFLTWARTLGKSSVSSAEEREFLRVNGLLDTPARFKTELLQDANSNLRSS